MKIWILVLIVILSCEKKEKAIEVSENALRNEKLTTVELSYEAPKSWLQEESISTMRKAQFKIPGKDDYSSGEMAVFHFPQMNVDPQSNLDRWIRQFKVDEGKDINDLIERQDFDIKDMKVNYIKLDGTYKKAANPFLPNAEIVEYEDYTLLAAIVNTVNGPWFFKAVGPSVTMEKAKPEFEAMILSVK